MSHRGAVGRMSSSEYACAVKYGTAAIAASIPPAAAAARGKPLIRRTTIKSGTPPESAIAAPTTSALARRVTWRWRWRWMRAPVFASYCETK